jgi:hypothetical protein
MLVALRRVQVRSDPEERRAERRTDAKVSLSQTPGNRAAQERSDAEHGSGSSRADSTLGSKIQAQTQPVSGRAARDENSESHRGRQRFPPRPGSSEAQEESKHGLPKDDSNRIEIGQRPKHHVVDGPSQRRQGDRSETNPSPASLEPIADDDTDSSCEHRQDRYRGAAAHVLPEH